MFEKSNSTVPNDGDGKGVSAFKVLKVEEKSLISQ